MTEMQQEAIIQFGKYEIYRKLALGGMAELYLAKQRGLGGFERVVVVKCILPQYSTDPQFLTMFLDEARIASQLNHPNIVQIYEIGEVHDLYYIAMEYVRGPNFKALRKALFHHYNQPSLELIAGIMVQVCSGLHHAHCAADSYGQPLAIVHRDVSPTNLLLTFEGTVKLVDFGVAKASIQEHQTVTGMVKGKYRYMSPEQILAYPIDHRSDVYSIGAILYELTTGVVLFQRNSEAETIRAVYMDPIIPPSTLVDGYPPALESIVMKALERDVHLRYHTADEMRRDLEQFMYSRGKYYGSQQIAEALQDMFTHVFEPSLAGDTGSALTHNDYVRFGFLAQPAPSALPAPHTLHGSEQGVIAPVGTESSSPSSPSSFQARALSRSGPVVSAGSAPRVPRPQQNAIPTREIVNTPLVPTQTLPPFYTPLPLESGSGQKQVLEDLRRTTDPIPSPVFSEPLSLMKGKSEDEKSHRSSWVLWMLVLLLLVGTMLVFWMSTSVSPTHKNKDAVQQLQQIAALLQKEQWEQAARKLHPLANVVLTTPQRDQYKELQWRLLRGQTLSEIRRLQQQGQKQEALLVLRSLHDKQPKDQEILLMLRRWETSVEPKNEQNPPIMDGGTTPRSSSNPEEAVDPDASKTGKQQGGKTSRNTKKSNRRKVVKRSISRVRRRPVRRRVVAVRTEAVRTNQEQNPQTDPPLPREDRTIPPAKGSLFVPAIPMAQVDIDGQLFGFTPINGKSLAPGRYRIRISKDGFVAVERTIVIAPGQRLVLPIKLQPIATAQPSDPPVIPTQPTSDGPNPALPFSAIKLRKSSETLRIYIADQRGIGGNSYTYQFRELCQNIERETQRILGSDFSTTHITLSLQQYVRQFAISSGREQMTFYPRAIAYVIYTQLARGRAKQRVAQLLLSYQKRNKFAQYNNR